MKNPRLMIPGALVVVALIAPTLSAADSTGKKKPFWNRLRQPKASAPAETPAPPPAEAATAPAATATAPAANNSGAAQTANPPPGATPAATPSAAGPSPAVTGVAAATAAPAGTTAAAPAGTAAPAGAAPAGAAPAAAASGTGSPAVATTTTVPDANSPAADNSAPVAAAAGVAVATGSGKKEHVTSGNKDVDRIIARMRTGPIGQEPSALPYLDLIGTGQATAAEMNDFASYIARKGLVEDACVIQKEAIDLDPKNSTLWLNLGLLERGAGRPAPAGKAFQRAVELYPANGVAWYNLGVIQDGDGQYDAAIESFRRALTIDPTLGDPKFNPQAINNPRLLVVRLMLAQQTAGTRALSLAPMQEVAQQRDTLEPETVPSPEKTPVETPTTPPPPKK